ncbi:radical SAM protein, partial [bacterium]|nr:radical SAM protein [bacterium]
LKPDVSTVNITSRCNLRCAMCMQPRSGEDADDSATVHGRGAEMTPDEWKRVVDQAASARPAFYFSGGEPLLYRGLVEILAHIRQRGLIAALVTNGTTLARHAKSLVEAGVDNITVSLDGPEEVHDAIRNVPGAFQRATAGIRAVREARNRAGTAFPTLKVNCVITPGNIRHLLETHRIARELGVEEFSLQHPMFDTEQNVALHNRVFSRIMNEPEGGEFVSKGEGEFYDVSFAPEEYILLESALDQMIEEAKGRPRLLFFPPVRRTDWKRYYLDLDFPFAQHCNAPWTNMRLLADGTFEPCLHYVIGNVRETPLSDLWNHERMRHFRRRLAERRLFPACVRCCYRSY